MSTSANKSQTMNMRARCLRPGLKPAPLPLKVIIHQSKYVIMNIIKNGCFLGGAAPQPADPYLPAVGQNPNVYTDMDKKHLNDEVAKEDEMQSPEMRAAIFNGRSNADDQSVDPNSIKQHGDGPQQSATNIENDAWMRGLLRCRQVPVSGRDYLRINLICISSNTF